jgi:cytoskeletal protein CcmA (bactofilin family)
LGFTISFIASGRGSDLNGFRSSSETTNGSDRHNGNGHVHQNGNGHFQLNGNGNGDTNTNGNRFRPVCATLSSGVSIKGTVKFRGELVFDGEIEGTIDATGQLTVGRNGRVRGDIRTRSVTIHGTVDGNLSAGEKCELRSGCTLRGDIETARPVMEENVDFIGNAAIAMRDYLSELRSPNGNGNDHANGHSPGNCNGHSFLNGNGNCASHSNGNGHLG